MPTPEELNENQARSQERVTTSAGQTSTALDDLTSAARRADEIFAKGILNVPRTLGDAVERLVGSTAATPVRFFESRMMVLNQLTNYGVSFNYSMRAMETQANQARMTLADLAAVVKENSERLSIFGVGATEGMTNFLNLQATAFRQQDRFGNDIETNLRRLGYSLNEINEAFMDYDTLLSFNRSRELRDARVRNAGAAEYARLLDEIADMTGKQRDKISDEIAERARQGQTQIQALQYGERGDEYMAFLGRMEATFGKNIADLSQDILGPGFGQTTTTRLLQGQMTPLVSLLRRLDQMYSDPSASDQDIRNLEAEIEVQAGLMRQIGSRDLAIFNRTSELGGVLAETYTQGGAGAVRIENLVEQLTRQMGRVPTRQELTRELIRLRDARQTGAQSDAPEGTDRSLRQRMIDQMITLERGQQTVRQDAIDMMFENMGPVLETLGPLITESIAGLIVDFNTLGATLQGWINTLGGGSEQRSIQRLIDEAGSLTPEAMRMAGELSDLLERRQTTTDAVERAELDTQIAELTRQLSGLQVQQMVIDAQNANIRLNNMGPGGIEILNRTPGAEPIRQDVGTLGTFGRLFNNWGGGTLAELHNLESVQTPEQMASIVEHSASGMAAAIVGAFQNSNAGVTQSLASADTMLRSNTNALNGTLNTISASVRDITSRGFETEPTVDTDAVMREFMEQLPRHMRASVEEAFGNTIRPSLENLVSLNREHVDTSNRIRKQTKGISRDYWGGA